MVDLLAKRGTDILQRSTRDLPLHSEILEINRIFKNCFLYAATCAAKNKSWRVLIKPNCVSDSPRAAAEFRLLTGQDCLCAHLYRFNLTDSPFCVLLDNYSRAFGDGPRHLEPWSRDEDDTSPNYHITPTGGRLSSSFSGTRLELMTRRLRVRYLDH
ncbi:uncharacterized protein TNCV_4631101 [Trichonephila clavipes]|nr:uncharacterized protein TNCV_4631101 [Trichonephila clavipes]